MDKLFSSAVMVYEAEPQMWDGDLYAEEEICIRHAAEKRRREFTAGRACARKVLRSLGVEDYPLLVGAEREPIWPEGVVGSISHCEGRCIVVATNDKSISSLGVDVELSGGLTEDLQSYICTQREMLWLKRMPSTNANLAKVIFSAKESIYKCLFPLIRIFLEFKDVEIDLNEQEKSFTVKLLHSEAEKLIQSYRLIGHYSYDDDFIITGVELRR